MEANWAATTHRSTRPAARVPKWPRGGTSMIETRLNSLETVGRVRSIRVSMVARELAQILLLAYSLASPPGQIRLFTYRRVRWGCISAAPAAAHREDICRKYEDTLLETQLSSVVTLGGTAVT